MAELGPVEARLADLKKRWLEDPSSRLFLQLAEEYRRIGRSAEALEILEAGLERNPNYTSALVARSRCLIDLGRSRDAISTLQQVLEKDATQLVAAKLLVEAYLQESDALLARRQLDLYTLINPSDSEIDALRARIQELVLADAGEPVRASTFPPPLVPGMSPPEPPIRAAAPEAPTPRLAEVRPFPSPASGGAEPFSGLVGARRRGDLVRALAADSIFVASVGGAAPAALLEEPPEVAQTSLSIVEASPVVDLIKAPTLEAEAGLAPASAPEFARSVDLDRGAPEPVDEASVMEPEVEDDADLDSAVSGPAAAVPSATATLGELYLAQGHLEEAERIYSEMLQAEPGSAPALAGLEAVAQARDRAREDATTASEAPGESDLVLPLAQRKVRLLKRFLAAVRSGRPRNVP